MSDEFSMIGGHLEIVPDLTVRDFRVVAPAEPDRLGAPDEPFGHEPAEEQSAAEVAHAEPEAAALAPPEPEPPAAA